MRLLGLDPGLRHTGWGVIDFDGNRLTHVANGIADTDGTDTLPARLVQLHDAIYDLVMKYRPDEAAVEDTFVNRNPSSTLKLGQARGIALLVPARLGIPVVEYSPRLVKKSVVGTGAAEKAQIQMMIGMLLPGCRIAGPDAADALAVAICHAHHRATAHRVAVAGGAR